MVIAVKSVTGIAIPSVTVGLVATAGGPPTVAGVSTLLAIFAGLATWMVWFVRYGRHGGDSGFTEKFGDRNRQERRWDF